jgi:hypothetical protein
MLPAEFNKKLPDFPAKPEIDDIKAQLRELLVRQDTLETTVNAQDVTPAELTPDIVPALVNFLDNTDFIYSDEAYNLATYTDDEDVLAQWYGRTQATASSYVENTGATESTESIRRSAHTSGARAGAEWDDSTGSLLLTGGYRVAGRLSGKFATAGNYIAARMQISRPVGATAVAEDIVAKLSLWDNTDNEVLKGDYPALTSSKIGTHTGGTHTRQYILEVQLSSGRKFFSDTVSFSTGDNQVVNAVSFVNIDSDDYVSVSWDTIVGAVRYRVYRRETTGADTDWYLIATVTNGSTSINDFGGTGGGVWAVPTFDADHLEFQVADAYFEDIGAIIQTENDIQEVSFGLRVPYNFNPNGDQFLQIEFLKADYTASTTTEIPADSIRIDRVGLCYTNGRWTASARDMALVVIPTGNPSPPPSTGGGGDLPPTGGGEPYCVVPNTRILVWSDDLNHYYMKASELVEGDRLVSWTGESYEPAKIRKIITAWSRAVNLIHANNEQLSCSFSHKLIADETNLEGTRIGLLKETCMMYAPDKPIKVNIDTIDTEYAPSKVLTFDLQRGKRIYIAEGFLCHNRKEEEGGGDIPL